MKKTALPAISMGRIITNIIIFSAIMVAQLVLFSDVFVDIIDKLETGDKEAPNAIWFIKFVAYLLPVLTLIVVQYLAYSPSARKKLGSATVHRELAIETFFLILIIYVAILPVVISISGSAEPAADSAETAKTLIENTTMWFAYQAIPHLVVAMYHRFKYKNEIEDAQN